MGEVSAWAPAKINLALRVGGRRADGFHPLNTLFHAVDLAERVTVRRLPISSGAAGGAEVEAGGGAGRDGGTELTGGGAARPDPAAPETAGSSGRGGGGGGPGRLDIVTVTGRDAAAVPLGGSNLAVRAAALLRRVAGASATATLEPGVPGASKGKAGASRAVGGGDGASFGSKVAEPAVAAAGAPDGASGANLIRGDGGLLGRGVAAAVEIAIDKAIPVAGGLAGGSADAAAALVALNELWRLGLSLEQLTGLAAELGSDVPFALVGGDAIGQGRGEALRPLEGGGRFEWVLLADADGLSTPAVFERFDALVGPERPAEPPPIPAGLLDGLRAGDPRLVGANLVNDLEPAAFDLRPELATRVERALAAGACGAVVSGSGPTVACLAADAAAADSLAARLAAAHRVGQVLRVSGPAPGACQRRP
ncbi:MAG: hypothetical protein LBO20_02635 [Bifidobacteriaceae bacterium]|jgi:4-diphosphocytidyl-2-C-methyl-D-erythritol kinase|nr:hypothetical protein [Bifidobacteriaceae bacterium]